MAIGAMAPPLIWPGMAIIEGPIGPAMPMRNCCCMKFCCANASCPAAPDVPPGAVTTGAVAAGLSQPDALFRFLPPWDSPVAMEGLSRVHPLASGGWACFGRVVSAVLLPSVGRRPAGRLDLELDL